VNSDKFDLSSKLNTYLIAIAKNKWRNELRKKGKIQENPIPENKKDENPGQLETILSNEKVETIQNALNEIKLGGFKLGFWFAQQGSIYVFIVLIFVYVRLMNKLDKKYGFDKQ
jgi:putative solute:sodium symporter small subunit